jgi:hypothetical protein
VRRSACSTSASSRRRPTKEVCSGRGASWPARARPPAAPPEGVAGGQQPAVEPPGRRLRVGGVLLGEGLTEPVERSQRLVAAAAGGQRRHQRPVRALVDGVRGDHRACDLDHLGVLAPAGQHLGVLHQQAQVALAQALAWPLGPVLEPVLGQQVAAVQRRGRAVVLRVAGLPCPQAGGLEGVGVEPRGGAVGQQHDVVAEGEQAAGGAAERARATYSAWCRLLAAAAPSRSGHRSATAPRGACAAHWPGPAA